jgi:hypothetical protein
MSNGNPSRVVPLEVIAHRIHFMRERKIMLDADLADLYGVPTKALNQAVKRNLDRFPEDFMFQLNAEETRDLTWSQSVTTSEKSRRISHLPLAFTEHGVAMLSSVLRSERAVQMNILIVRAFITIRELLANNKELGRRVEKLEVGQNEHKSVMAGLAHEIDRLKKLPVPVSRRIGFTADIDKNS